MAVDADESSSSDAPPSSHRSPSRLAAIRSSFSLQIAAAGVVCIALGFALGTGVWAGMLPIWGFAFVVIGLGTYAVANLSRRGTKG